jgi:hypothetical protein
VLRRTRAAPNECINRSLESKPRGCACSRARATQVLDPLVGADDVVLNLSVDVSSVALIALCAERGALYLDTARPQSRCSALDEIADLVHMSVHLTHLGVAVLRR